MKFSLRALILCCGLTLGFTQTVPAQSYTFKTICGTPGVAGTQNGTNLNAQFFGQAGIGIDTSGRLFVAEPFTTTIRMVTRYDTNFVVSSIAGSFGGFGSADGINSAAQFASPFGVAVDAAGDVYVTDTGNNTIRKLSADGLDWVVTTIAGQAGSSGNDDGVNNAARFSSPSGIAADVSGNLYVADEGNNTIRKISRDGTNWVTSTISGVAGEAGTVDGLLNVARLTSPRGIAVDTAGNVFIATDDMIRKLTPVGTNWSLKTIAGQAAVDGSTDGTNLVALFGSPAGIAVDTQGVLYVSETLNNTIRKITPVGTNYVTTTIGGSAGNFGSTDGTGSAARFDYPVAITVDDDGALYISDSNNSIIRRGKAGTTVVNLAPVALCQTAYAVANSNGVANASVDAGSFDPDNDTFTLTQVPPGPYHNGTNEVTLIVTDSRGASNTCTASVIIFDRNAPNITSSSNPGFFQINGHTGQVVVLEVSTNLANWTALQTNTLTTGKLEFSDPYSNRPRRFYRAKLWP